MRHHHRRLPGRRIPRRSLYRSCPHLKAEFEQQFARQREAGQALDRREDRGARLKARSTELTQRIVGQDAELEDLR